MTSTTLFHAIVRRFKTNCEIQNIKIFIRYDVKRAFIWLFYVLKEPNEKLHAIWYHLNNLKNCEKHPWNSDTSSKVAG